MDFVLTLSNLVDFVSNSATLDAVRISCLQFEDWKLSQTVEMCTGKFDTWNNFTPTPANSYEYHQFHLQTLNQVRNLLEQRNAFVKKFEDAIDSNRKILDDFYSRTMDLEAIGKTQAENMFNELWDNASFIWNIFIFYDLEEQWKEMGLNDKLNECIRQMDKMIQDESTLVQPGTD
ncbi:unnamed protein product [Orchesella dallaii]|uniref:Uncharacterized protein n=1 Tax=Orchesella dallaii TaxID=48710 RepID=A0ABP1QKD7_9HEXA